MAIVNDIELIETHVADGKDRLLQQYREKIRVEGFLQGLNEQIQDLETLGFGSIVEKRPLPTAEGAALDEWGETVGEPRSGFSDEIYRALILAKIGENVSQTDIERIISIVLLLTGTEQVLLQEFFPAGFGVAVSTPLQFTLTQELINFLYQRIDRVDAAGVRFEAFVCYAFGDAFAFAGGPGDAGGFGDLNDALIGGQFAELHLPTLPAFSFISETPDDDFEDAGFGTEADILFGGILAP